MFLLHRNMSFYLAAIGGAIGFITAWFVDRDLASVIGANCFFVLYLVLTLFALPKLKAAHLKKHAASADEPVWIIFLVTFATVLVAVASLFIIINRQALADALSLALSDTVTLPAPNACSKFSLIVCLIAFFTSVFSAAVISVRASMAEVST